MPRTSVKRKKARAGYMISAVAELYKAASADAAPV